MRGKRCLPRDRFHRRNICSRRFIPNISALQIFSVLRVGKLCALNDEGATILLITHDMHLADLAKRVVRIMDGQVVEDSITPQDKREPLLREVGRA